MKSLLPTSSLSINKDKGFTLIELLVVMAIIAILAVISISTYINIQKNARDTRRKAEVTSIAHSIESSKTPGSSTYTYTSTNLNNDYPNGIPTDPSGSTLGYCIATSITVGTAPTAPSANSTSGCPTNTWAPGTNGDNYAVMSGSGSIPAKLSAGTATSWNICASLENGSLPFCVASINK